MTKVLLWQPRSYAGTVFFPPPFPEEVATDDRGWRRRLVSGHALCGASRGRAEKEGPGCSGHLRSPVLARQSSLRELVGPWFFRMGASEIREATLSRTPSDSGSRMGGNLTKAIRIGPPGKSTWPLTTASRASCSMGIGTAAFGSWKRRWKRAFSRRPIVIGWNSRSCGPITPGDRFRPSPVFQGWAGAARGCRPGTGRRTASALMTPAATRLRATKLPEDRRQTAVHPLRLVRVHRGSANGFRGCCQRRS